MPSVASALGFAVKLTFCSRPWTTCGAIGSDTSASSCTFGVESDRFQNLPPSEKPFGSTTATGTVPARTSASAAARSRAGPAPSSSAVVRTRSPPSAASALTSDRENSV